MIMKRYRLLFIFLIALGMASCTEDFAEINKDPNAITKEEASARYFITDPQYQLYGPDRYPYWRAHLIHTDRYAGYFTFGFNGSWWSDELGYSYSSGYTDAAWGWLAGYFGRIDNFLKLTEAGGDFENELMHAVGKIIKGLYYQMYTDIFGELPYLEAGVEGIVTPKYDEQKTIYEGVIAELDEAMATIGDNTITGEGINDLGDNDLYFGGDLTMWKKLANTLKLRIALRALGAEGAGFADAAITEALNAGLFLEDESDNCVMEKDDVISQWSSSSYGDVWHNFGGYGSKWHVGQPLVDNLRNNNDPRLDLYAVPASGGVVDLIRPAEDPGKTQFDKHVAFVTQTLTDAGVVFTETVDGDTVTIDMPEDTYYVGQPVRMGGDIYSYIRREFFSFPAPEVVAQKKSGTVMWDEIILTTAESYFLRAEAALNGFPGDAESLYQEGIRYAMRLWNVPDTDIETFIGTEEMALLNGTTEQNMEKVSIQRWLACYTDGFEGWAIARKSGFPAELTETRTDPEIYGLGDINGLYPERMRYGSGVSNAADNYDEVIARQGPDRQDTKLWWAK